MKEGLLQERCMLLFRSPESFVLPVVRRHTGVALFVFWCCLVRDLLISIYWFSLIAISGVMVWVSTSIAYLF